jgi:hypothetical protein
MIDRHNRFRILLASVFGLPIGAFAAYVGGGSVRGGERCG